MEGARSKDIFLHVKNFLALDEEIVFLFWCLTELNKRVNHMYRCAFYQVKLVVEENSGYY